MNVEQDLIESSSLLCYKANN